MSGTEKRRRFRAIERLSRYAAMADVERLDRLRMKRDPLDKGAPAAIAMPKPRETELIGCDEDGNMSVWSTGQVQPVSHFELTQDFYIKSGHYVIDWKGHAITVHCGNYADGNVSVRFMCSEGETLSMHRFEVESLLLGKVISDAETKSEISKELKRLAEEFMALGRAPRKPRGRIPLRKEPPGQE
jgi:hypothetical protein